MPKKKKKNREEPDDVSIFYGILDEEISPAIAYRQAATLLDMASVYAVESNDIEGITVLARAWAEMAVLMQGSREEKDDNPVVGGEIGFRAIPSREVTDDISKGKGIFGL